MIKTAAVIIEEVLQGIFTSLFVIVVIPITVVAFAVLALLRSIRGMDEKLKGARSQEVPTDAHGFPVEEFEDGLRHLHIR